MFKVCSKCKKSKLFSEFNKMKASSDGYQYKCNTCKKEYRVSNVEKRKEYKVKYRAANPNYRAEYHAANSEKIKESNVKYRAANSEKLKDYAAKYQKANLDKGRAKESKRRAIKLLALPFWLTKEDYKAIEALCKEADRLTQETGIKHHIDHIHPLQGKLICGFHCPANLQILTDFENRSKHNRFVPYVESENRMLSI